MVASTALNRHSPSAGAALLDGADLAFQDTVHRYEACGLVNDHATGCFRYRELGGT
jgi:hypothetical protein